MSLRDAFPFRTISFFLLCSALLMRQQYHETECVIVSWNLLQVINQNVYIFPRKLPSQVEWTNVQKEREKKIRFSSFYDCQLHSLPPYSSAWSVMEWRKMFMFCMMSNIAYHFISTRLGECITFYVLNAIIKMQFVTREEVLVVALKKESMAPSPTSSLTFKP